MLETALQVGAPYYRVTWSNPDFTIPGVSPFIFVGTNIGDEDSDDHPQYYFQDALSYFWCGSIANTSMTPREDIEPEVAICGAEELAQCFVTLDEVVKQLSAALTRGPVRSAEQ